MSSGRDLDMLLIEPMDFSECVIARKLSAEFSMDGRNSTDVLLHRAIYDSSPSRAPADFYEISLQENDGTSTCATAADGGAPNKHQQQQHPSVAFYKLFCFADALDCLFIFWGTIGACVHGAAMPVFFIFFGKLIDSFGSNYNNSDLMQRQVSKYALYFFYLGLVVLGAGWLEVSCWMQTGERQATKMRAEYLRAMLNQDVGFFDTDATTGEIVSCITGDTLLVQDAISEKLGNFIHYIARFTAGFAVGFSCIWQLTLVTLAVVPAIALAGGVYALIMVGLTSRSQKAYAKAGHIAEEAIAQVRTVYSFVGEMRAVKRYSEALGTTLKLGESSGLAKGLGVGSTYGLLFGAWALLLWYASVLVRHGTANGGQALTTILSVIVGGIALGQAAPNLTAFGKGKAAGFNVLEMIRRQKSSSSSTTSGDKILPALNGHVEFRNVYFFYPSRPDVTIFQRFCLTIPAGKTVAIVGGSGSGKSTVISLIERFYDPISGKVLLDGEDIKLLDLKWLRLQIGLVNQEPALFATSILENILYGKENATMEEVEEAAKIANTHSFIEQLPDGYNTQVGERGVQLSGGQKQRIAIARAMLKNPKIILLDEATSALDAASERTVQDALDKLMVGRTTVVVAHRLSTVRNADTIAVLKLGIIVEIGTHDELVCRGEMGAYNSLIKLQEPLMNKRADEACSNRRVSRGSSLSHRNFSFHSSIRSETNSTSMYMEQEEMGYQRIKGSMSLYWRLFKMNMPEWPYTVIGSLGAVMAGTETPLFALAVSQVLITYYSPDEDQMEAEVRKYALIFTGASLATVLIYVLQHYSFAVMGERLTMRIREELFSAILRNEVGWFDCDENNSSILASRLASDATFVKASIADRMSTMVQNLALIVTSFLIAFIVEWHVTLVILATFPFIIAAALGEHLFLKGFGGDLASEYSKASIVAGEAVSNIRTVAAFCAEDKVLRLFAHKLKAPKQKSFIRGHIAGIGYGLSQLCMFSSYALALWYSSKLVADHKTKFGNVMKAFMVLVITAFGIAETLALAPDIVKGSQALSSVFEILDRQSQIDPDDKHAEELSKVKGEVELSNVDFSYPLRPGNIILMDFSFRVKAGQSFALVGASGSGKSSVIALISRFYDPIFGKVMVDGRDIRRFNLRSLRRHIGLVQQEPALFMTNIYENILYGRKGATEAEVVEAAKASNAHGFISALPNGYRTEAGERGVQLSGGQKQRIAIARAVLKDPGILLLDEATSALDAESEKVVQQALDRLMKGRTTVVIAHRLSTIRNTDRIAVLQDGKIVEQGSYVQLMSQNGSFAKLNYLAGA